MNFKDRKQHFSLWLKSIPGCKFATQFTSTKEEGGRIHVFDAEKIDDSTPDLLTSIFEGAAKSEFAAVVLLSFVNSETELIDCIKIFCKNERWRYEVKIKSERPEIFLSLEWKTSQEKWSRMLGFAPLPFMPVTRRAPYFALGLWPGPSSSKNKSQYVGLIDMPSKIEPGKHKDMLEESMENAKNLLNEDPNKAPWREIAFSFGASSFSFFTP
jgi:hypothetical protein